jgi:hypothetical protein
LSTGHIRAALGDYRQVIALVQNIVTDCYPAEFLAGIEAARSELAAVEGAPRDMILETVDPMEEFMAAEPDPELDQLLVGDDGRAVADPMKCCRGIPDALKLKMS